MSEFDFIGGGFALLEEIDFKVDMVIEGWFVYDSFGVEFGEEVF